MLNFKPDPRDQGFSLDKRAKTRRRGLHPREWRALVMLPFALTGVVWVWYELVDLGRQLAQGPQETISRELPLEPMPDLALVHVDPLPDQAAIDTETEPAKALVDQPDVSLVVGGLDPVSLAWARLQLAADRSSPPIPQRAYSRDLLLGEVRAGSAILVAGRIIDHADAAVAGSEPWQRILLLADGDAKRQQFIQLLVDHPDRELVIGTMITGVGRYLGRSPVPTATGATSAVQVPTLAIRALVRQEVDAASDPLSEFHRLPPERLPVGIFDGISDERGLVETRAYYHLIGQAWADRERQVPADLPVLNREFHLLHAKPDEWRGRRSAVEITIYDQWEDTEATRDHPFGAPKITRLLGYTRDIGPWVETDAQGKEYRSIKSVLRLVEFVLVGDDPRPLVGNRIRADGRFLKYRAITVPTNALRDTVNKVRRESDKAYSAVVVGSAWKLVPPRPPMTVNDWVWTIAVLVLVLGAAFALIMIVRKDHRSQGKLHSKIRKLREQRHALLGQGRKNLSEQESAGKTEEPTP